MQRLALGVDIGGTKVLTALVTEDGRIIREWRTPTDALRGGPAVLQGVQDALSGILSELSPNEKPAGIGICAAGQVDWNEGAIAYASPNIPGWTGTQIKAQLESALGLPVTVENDANAAAFGEWWAGAGRGGDSTVLLTIGTGVGGGIISNGKVLRGGRFRGGEVGHMILVADGIPCNCGQRGCLEVYASGTAIAREAQSAMPGWLGTTPEVFTLALEGDAEADKVLGNAARALALGIVSLSSVLDPDRFLLGGGVASAPTYIDRVRAALLDPAVSGERGFDTRTVVAASLGEAAGVVGAAGLLFGTLAERV